MLQLYDPTLQNGNAESKSTHPRKTDTQEILIKYVFRSEIILKIYKGWMLHMFHNVTQVSWVFMSLQICDTKLQELVVVKNKEITIKVLTV